MKSLACLFALASLAFVNTAACLAQQPGPATLEGLVNSGEAQEATKAAEAGSTDAAPKRPAGTVSRPKDGVQHPDLDKAWAEYDAVVTKAAESIRTAISKQFDAATSKGDLDAAEKWQAIGEKFEQMGELPAEPETKPAVSAAVADYKKAREALNKAYESVVKSLTIEKKIADAKAARDEVRSIIAKAVVQSETHASEEGDSSSSPQSGKVISRKTVLSICIGAWRHPSGTVEEIREGGVFVVRDIKDPWSGQWILDLRDPLGPCVVRKANNGTMDRFYVDLANPDILMHQSGTKFQRQR
jgi:hypothetical protein